MSSTGTQHNKRPRSSEDDERIQETVEIARATQAYVKEKYGRDIDEADAILFHIDSRAAKRQRRYEKEVSKSRGNDMAHYRQNIECIEERLSKNPKGLDRIYFEALRQVHEEDMEEFKEKQRHAIVID